MSSDAGLSAPAPDASTTEGRLPPETIRRVIRSAFPRFRKCYEVALAANPNARGGVSSRFVIGLDGVVELVYSEAMDASIPASMVDCISNVYLRVEFPPPLDGKVMVTYPIDFQNEK